jgi:hypothetical protein
LKEKRRAYYLACLPLNKGWENISSSLSGWEMGMKEKRYRRNTVR